MCRNLLSRDCAYRKPGAGLGRKHLFDVYRLDLVDEVLPEDPIAVPQQISRRRIPREGWIHLGSPQAGPKAAAIRSVVETCRRRVIPVRQYLAAALPGLESVSIRKAPELTPAAWAAGQA